MPEVDGTASAASDRAVYLMTRDNILEGDSGASAAARALGLAADPPAAMRISVPEDVGSNVEAIVARDGAHWWKLVRTFDDPETWTQPGIRHLAASGPDGDRFRTVPLADEWELYDLTVDPIEVTNLWNTVRPELRNRLVERLDKARRDCVPARNSSWRYATRRAG